MERVLLLTDSRLAVTYIHVLSVLYCMEYNFCGWAVRIVEYRAIRTLGNFCSIYARRMIIERQLASISCHELHIV